jgi:cysteine synthase
MSHSPEPAGRARHPGNVYEDAFDAVGNTPLVRLREASARTGCEVYGKCEYASAAGGASVKARAAKWLIQDAEDRGLLKPGGTIVEATAGNTGIALAELAAVKGYKTVIVIPSSQSTEKKDALRFAGAQLVQVPPKPSAHPNHYVKVGERLARNLGAVFAGQFDNPANRHAHVATTGPEIFQQLGGRVDGFSCAIGTGGTLAGVAEYLRSATAGKVKIALTDPQGAKLVSWYNDGVFEAQGNSISEGIGQVRVTGAIGDAFKPDYSFEISDEEALRVTFDLMQNEGLSLGLSSGINVAGAIHLAERLGPGHTVVTILCDVGSRYKDKLFNVEFLRSKGLPIPEWLAEDGPCGPTGLSAEVSAAMETALEAEPAPN